MTTQPPGPANDRVVAVVVHVSETREKWGTGYLVTPNEVLTAWHCTVADPKTADGTRVRPVTVQRRGPDGAWEHSSVTSMTVSRRWDGAGWGLDVALLTLADPPWSDADWEPPIFARCDRGGGGLLRDCEAVGYPSYAIDPTDPDQKRSLASLSGIIRVADRANEAYEHLILRDTEIGTVQEWGGLSGALVFYDGYVLGHVVEHHPHLGNNPIKVVPASRLARADGRYAKEIATRLGISSAESLELVRPSAPPRTPSRGQPPGLHPPRSLHWVEDGLPREELGIKESTRLPGDLPDTADPDLSTSFPLYVERDQDQRVRRAIQNAADSGGGIVLLRGEPGSGKSRCLYEAVREVLPRWRLFAPVGDNPSAELREWALGADLGRTVIWLDEIAGFLGSDKVPYQVFRDLLDDRENPVVILGTIWPNTYADLTSASSSADGRDYGSRDARLLLKWAPPDRPTLEPIDISPEFSEEEHARAVSLAARDPRLETAVTEHGRSLAQSLAAAPAIRERRDRPTTHPGRAVLRACADIQRYLHPEVLPVPGPVLRAVALTYMSRSERATATSRPGWFDDAVAWACAPVRGSGSTPMQALAPADPFADEGQIEGYVVSHFLLRDGPDDPPAELSADAWRALAARADDTPPPMLGQLARTAYRKKDFPHAEHIALSAQGRDAAALLTLGNLKFDDGDRDAAEQFYRQAHALDETYSPAMNALGFLAHKDGRVGEEREWYERAHLADGSAVWPMNNLGVCARIHGDQQEADEWHRRAYEADPTVPRTMTNLGDIAARRGSLAEQRDWYQQAHAADPLLSWVLSRLGDIEEQAGDATAALGWREKALASAQSAVDTYQALRDGHPERYAYSFAESLRDLSGAHAALGQHDAALIVTQQEVALYRDLVHRSERMLPELAEALRTLSFRLGMVKKGRESLLAGTEAADVYKLLADRNPRAFRGHYAAALHDAAYAYVDLDREIAARIMRRQALLSYRMAADQDSDWRSPLAGCLEALAGSYTDYLSTAELAVPLLQEARLIRRQEALIDVRQKAELADVDASLGRALMTTGRFQAAVAVAAHEIHVRGGLVHQGHQWSWFRAHLRLAEALALAKRPVAARRAALQAELLGLRLLGRRSQTSYSCVVILRKMARMLILSTRDSCRPPQRALTYSKKALEIHRRLAANDPERHVNGSRYTARSHVDVLARFGAHDPTTMSSTQRS
ncbi:trypsin-like serine protease [Nocardioides panzhihuensis]|uniref:Tetratricopeptide (TPR) repeat protein n=1 Tax=Nocardioides panzhihuensis TaxID=860243 RepID=A0A7Z0DJC8_9ACTN|nr:trypsin-like serine protease [Nocardioides panzhihuensis]NYI76679.1 tetratricopeptide (TPR) repeat protein [Nocardioides panzhihuensis]